MLEFYHKDHQYKMKGVIYTSVSSVVARYKQPFDSDFWSTYKALEKLIGYDDFKEMRRVHGNYKSPQFIEWACGFVELDELKKTTEKILKEWTKERDDSIVKGHAYHDKKEKQAYGKGFEINPFTEEKFNTIGNKPKGKDKMASTSDLYNLPDGYHPELMLWNNEYLIGGTADKVFLETKGKKRLAYLDDYKTNKKIDTENPWDKMRTPLHHLDDCNYNHYRVQIALYAWMLEQSGFTIKGTAFTHLNKKYKFSYIHMRRHIVNMLNHFKNETTQ